MPAAVPDALLSALSVIAISQSAISQSACSLLSKAPLLVRKVSCKMSLHCTWEMRPSEGQTDRHC